MRDLYIRSMGLLEQLPRENYLAKLPVVKHLADGGITFHKQVTFFVGENGSGKSTLIEALAISQGFNPEGGTKNRAESFYNVASNIDQMDREPGVGGPVINSYGGVSLHRQSHGESFLALVENRFGGQGLYILDEPEAAMSPRGIIRLMQNMDELVRRDSQFIIATHSPMLLAFPGAEVYQIREEGIDSVRFQDTDHYRTTVRFLQNPESAVEEILGRDVEN